MFYSLYMCVKDYCLIVILFYIYRTFFFIKVVVLSMYSLKPLKHKYNMF